MQGFGNLIEGAKKMVQIIRSNNVDKTDSGKKVNLKFPKLPDLQKPNKEKIETIPILET